MDDKFQNLKVMVIDDSKTIRRTAETLLQREGYDSNVRRNHKACTWPRKGGSVSRDHARSICTPLSGRWGYFRLVDRIDGHHIPTKQNPRIYPPRVTVPTNRASPRSAIVRPSATRRRNTHRGHIDDQLPERLVPRAGIHIPQCIVNGAQRDVNDALLRTDPAKQSTSSANNGRAHAKQKGQHMRARSVAAWHGTSTWRG